MHELAVRHNNENNFGGTLAVTTLNQNEGKQNVCDERGKETSARTPGQGIRGKGRWQRARLSRYACRQIFAYKSQFLLE